MSEENTTRPKLGLIPGGKDLPKSTSTPGPETVTNQEIEARASAMAQQFATELLGNFSNRMLYLDKAIQMYGNMYIAPGDEEDVIKIAQRIKHYVETGN